MGSVIAYEVASYSLNPELRRGVKTLCTMGTVLDMIRYILGGEGLVLAEQVRFGQDIPREAQGKAYPRWLNLFARNDPAAGFSPLLEFKGATNRPVCSTSKGHSTYWNDRRGVICTFLAWVARGNPIFDKPVPPPPLSCQTSIAKDFGMAAAQLLLFVGLVVGAALVGSWQFDVNLTDLANELDRLLRNVALPWPLSWLALALVWLLANLMTLIVSLPGWYLKWLLWIGVALGIWVVLALPTVFKSLWHHREVQRLVPTAPGSNLDYWVGVLEKMGPIYELTLRKRGIWTVRDFLVAVARPGGLTRLAGILGVSEEWALERARQANLMRLSNVDPEQARSLLLSGIDSLAALSQQEHGSMSEQMAPSFGLQRPPAGEQLGRWIEEAKTLQDVI
jgi:hypothetical protein